MTKALNMLGEKPKTEQKHKSSNDRENKMKLRRFLVIAIVMAGLLFTPFAFGQRWGGYPWGSDLTGEQEKIVRLSADVTNETIDLADVTGLSFVPVANKDYLVEFFVIYTTNATTTGLNLSVNGPASPTAMVWINMISSSATSGRHYQFNTYDGGATSNGAIAGSNYAYLFGLFRNGSTSGTLILRFATEASLTSVTIKEGSVLRYRRIK